MNDNSIFISFLKKVMYQYRVIGSLLVATYKNSRVHRLIKAFREGAGINFRYSFLGRVMEIGEQGYLTVFNNSRFVKGLLNVYKMRKGRIINYAGVSEFTNSAKEFKNDFFSIPVKIGSIIVLTTILSNIFFSILLNKGIGLFGWVIRGLFLLVALSGLFCSAKWQDMKDASFVVKFINTHCKIQN